MNEEELMHPFVQKLQKSKNHLIVKDSIGRAKPSVRELPKENYTYGKKNTYDEEGVS